MIETRKTEQRYTTSDPRKMLNRYLAKRVLKTWTEDFFDEDTGNVCSIERNEVLFDKGTLIDQDLLAKIRFCMEAEGITQVEVSNQKRVAFENENRFLYPYMAQAQIGDKKHKFLLYATGIENATIILKDYIELNYQSGFTLSMVKEFDACIILTDNLKERKVDTLPLDWEEEDLSVETEEEKPNEKKFYQIESKITFDEEERTQSFVVHTFNVDRAMMLITHYLKSREEEYEKQAYNKGNLYNKKDIHAAIESAKPIPVGRFIPKEFSEVYV